MYALTHSLTHSLAHSLDAISVLTLRVYAQPLINLYTNTHFADRAEPLLLMVVSYEEGTLTHSLAPSLPRSLTHSLPELRVLPALGDPREHLRLVDVPGDRHLLRLRVARASE